MIFKCGDIVMYGASFTVCNSPTQKIGVVIEAIPNASKKHTLRVQWFGGLNGNCQKYLEWKLTV